MKLELTGISVNLISDIMNLIVGKRIIIFIIVFLAEFLAKISISERITPGFYMINMLVIRIR